MTANQIAGIVQGGIGLTAAIGGALYGGIKSGKLNKQAELMIRNQRTENKRWYDIRMAQDYTQRADVQATINRQRELLNEQYKRARATNAVMGGSDESLALQQQAANQSLAQTMSDVASQASGYKDNVEQQYRQQDAALNQQQVQGLQQRAAATAQAASQVVNSGIKMVGDSFETFSSSPVKSNA